MLVGTQDRRPGLKECGWVMTGCNDFNNQSVNLTTVAESMCNAIIHLNQCLHEQVRDQARRFITLIDELYNARVRLVCTADSPPDLLFAGNLNEEPIIDLEQLQYEGAVEGQHLHSN